MFDLFLPLAATFIGLFTSLYQVFVEGGVLNTMFFQYILIFVSFPIFTGLFALFSASSKITYEEKKIGEYISAAELLIENDA